MTKPCGECRPDGTCPVKDYHEAFKTKFGRYPGLYESLYNVFLTPEGQNTTTPLTEENYNILWKEGL